MRSRPGNAPFVRRPSKFAFREGSHVRDAPDDAAGRDRHRLEGREDGVGFPAGQEREAPTVARPMEIEPLAPREQSPVSAVGTDEQSANAIPGERELFAIG